MQVKDVLIRSVAYLDKRDKELLKSFMALKDKVPIYYQYCQTNQPVPVNHKNEPNLIGYANNMHIQNGMLLCDVEILDLIKVSNNFDGTIDNYVLGVNKKGNPAYIINKFVVYDRDFKRKVDAIMRDKINLNDTTDEKEEKKQMSVCMEIAGAESIPELEVEAQKAN